MFNHANRAIRKITGFTLLELMLSITLSLFILGSVTEIFITMQKNFRLQLALSSIQEHKRLTMEWLHADLSIAGYIGCPKLTENFPLKKFHQYELTPQNKIVISQNQITVRHASLKHTELLKDMMGFSTFVTNADEHFMAGNILLISDCMAAEIFQVKKIIRSKNFQKLTTTEPLSSRFHKGAEVSKLEINTYFTDKTDRKTESGLPLSALYLTNIQHKKIELVEGVDDMKVNFNQNHNGIYLSYLFSSVLASSPLFKTGYQFVALRE